MKSVLHGLVLISALFLMASSQPQCAKTTDRALNPSTDFQSTGNPCVDSCQDKFQADKFEEFLEFKLAHDACGNDMECRDTVSEEHELAVAAIVAEKDLCIADCEHEQGLGTGGQ